MAKQDPIIRIAATIGKDDLEYIAPLYGATNAGPIAEHAPGTLRLVTFAGAYSTSAGKFIGEYRFTITDTPGEQVFHALPGVPSNKRSRKAADSSEVSNG